MYEFPPGSSGVSIYFLLRDSATNLGKTGLTASTPGALATYTRNRGAATPFALVAITPQAAWTSGGFAEVDAVNQRGVYRLDVPNNALAAGVPHAVVKLAFDNTIDDGALIRLVTSESNVGPGAISYAVTVTKPDLTPISGAQCWVSTDEDGDNTIAGALTTDAFGIATFFLDAGTYYLWVQSPHYTGANPTTINVS